jgi:hypothetical protein
MLRNKLHIKVIMYKLKQSQMNMRLALLENWNRHKNTHAVHAKSGTRKKAQLEYESTNARTSIIVTSFNLLFNLADPTQKEMLACSIRLRTYRA